jgi:hypothetical protein
MGPTNGPNQCKEPFREQFVLLLKEALQAFAMTTPGFAHDKRSRWAYVFNPMPDGEAEKPVLELEVVGLVETAFRLR